MLNLIFLKFSGLKLIFNYKTRVVKKVKLQLVLKIEKCIYLNEIYNICVKTCHYFST